MVITEKFRNSDTGGLLKMSKTVFLTYSWSFSKSLPTGEGEKDIKYSWTKEEKLDAQDICCELVGDASTVLNELA